MNDQQATEAAPQKFKWVSLESNPRVLNKFIYSIGVGKKVAFHDCVGLAPELLSFIPQPCLALVLLLPIPEKKKEPEGENKPTETTSNSNVMDLNDVYFMKQIVGNACGSIAVIHAIANKQNKLEITKDSPIANFLSSTAGKSSEERGKLLGLDEGIAGVHEQVSKKGQTKPDEDHYRTDFHFIVFMTINGLLVELDGTKPGPVVHGASSEDTFLTDAAAAINTVMLSNPGELFYSVLSFGPALGDEAEDAEREEKQVSEGDVATLVSMGFNESASREALKAAGSVEAAMELLITNL